MSLLLTCPNACLTFLPSYHACFQRYTPQNDFPFVYQLSSLLTLQNVNYYSQFSFLSSFLYIYGVTCIIASQTNYMAVIPSCMLQVLERVASPIFHGHLTLISSRKSRAGFRAG
ncbi:hypothetical protein BDW59DRAFT_29250 [Aspergillus cavernicola]|uniref:Uncharacterized protein n=1 Tax=Aspergillus cavernicola TaxID=176166 RepID=A0ABR4IT63_9EURO